MKMIRFHKHVTRLLYSFILLCLLDLNLGPIQIAQAAPGDTTRISVSSNGIEGNGASFLPSISADGRYVAFGSDADNFVSGDTNNVWDVFVHDRQTGQTTRVSVASDGSEATGGSSIRYGGSISADGRYVAFSSDASNLVNGDTNNQRDVFVHDRQTGQTTRVSVTYNGIQGNDDSDGPSLSADGRYVAFQSYASNLDFGDTNSAQDIFIHDMQTGDTKRVAPGYDPSISADGHYVVYYASDNNYWDVFIRNLQTFQSTRVSVAPNGVEGNSNSFDPSVSTDGHYVAFASYASNLVSGDANGTVDVFIRDMQTGQTRRVSESADGAEGTGDSLRPSISANGRYVAFDSYANNLADGDLNGSKDILVRDMQTGQITRASVSSGGLFGASGSEPSSPSISGDGRYVAFDARTSDLIYEDTNDVRDVFVHENTMSTTRFSISGNTGVANVLLNYIDGSPQTVFSAADGSYSFTVPSGWSGIVTPSKAAYSFSPVYRSYINTQTDQINQDFTAFASHLPSLSISQIQVIQSTQTTDESTPLVEGKVTSIRLFLSCETDCPRRNVTVTLKGPPGLILTPINQSIDVENVSNWETQIADLGKTLNFSLPPSSANGSFVFTAELDGITYIREVSFVKAKPLKIAYVPIRSEGYEPNADDIRNSISLMRKVYPTNEINYMQLPTWRWNRRQACYLLTEPDWIYSCLSQDLKSQLTGLYQADDGDFIFGWLPPQTYMGKIIGDSDPTWLNGNGRAAFGIAAPDVILRNRIITHEVGHLLGARHTNTGVCGDEDPGTDWHFSTPKIQNWGIDAYGFGWLLASNSALRDPDVIFDYMSYCEVDKDTSWTSSFTFEKILSTSLQAATSPLTSESQINEQPYFMVTGMVVADGNATLEPIWSENITTPINPPAGTAYCLEAEGLVGDILARNCFDLSFMDYETGAMSGSAGFSINLPNPGGVARVVLKKGSQELVSLQVTPNSPQIAVTYPNGGEVWSPSGNYTITWNASDLDQGDTLLFKVYFSPDGVKWLPLGTAINETQLTVRASELAGSANATIRVVASDGLNTTRDESDNPFVVAPKEPQVSIYSPEGAGEISTGAPLLLDGSAFDFEDGILGDNSLSWSSDIDGTLGNGTPIQVYLSPGQHTITLTATDSDQTVGSSAVAVHVLVCHSLDLSHLGQGSDPVATPSHSTGCPIGEYTTGESIGLRAFPAINWAVSSWAGTSQDNINATTNMVTMPASDRSVSVNYVLACFAINTSVNPGNAGVVWINQITDGIFNPPPRCQDDNQYPYGAVIRLTANPELGYTFNNWSGDIPGNTNPVDITMLGDHSVAAHFTNGADTTGVFRPSNGALYLKNKNETGIADIQINYGLPGDYPVVGDWDGDGDATIGIYRNGSFYLRNENTIGFADVVFPFGAPGDQPVAGDWDGDGVDTIGVYRNGIFFLRNTNSTGAPEMSFALGIPGDVGLAGDWDGDGFDSTGVFRPSNGALYLKNKNETGIVDIQINYGLPGDKPVTGDWNNDGTDTIGIYRNGSFYLRNSNTIGFADIVFALGIPGDMPIAGNWDGQP